MRESLFVHLFKVFRKEWYDENQDEPFSEIFTFRGRIQLDSGSLGSYSGTEGPQISATIYAPVKSKVHAGDRIYDAYGRGWVVGFVQPGGISDFDNHQEISVESLS